MAGWRSFFRALVGSFAIGAALVYAFVFATDPFDTLHLAPRFERGPIATNARYSFPALARNPRFDSAIIGTSTSRLLRPAQFDALFGARFVNLSMNDARAYEQYRIGLLFAAAHPKARHVLIGVDKVWCTTGATYERFSPRPFPMWMYDKNPWNDYAEQFNLYALEHAAKQFLELTGIVARRYGLDGYTNFLPPEREYDLARARGRLYPHGPNAIRPVEPPVRLTESERQALNFPTHPLLDELLSAFDRSTRVILFFVPYHVGIQPAPGSRDAAVWAECKTRVSEIASRQGNAMVVDFMFASAVTVDDANYWDPLHYRVAIADWIARALHDVSAGAVGEYGQNFIRLDPR